MLPTVADVLALDEVRRGAPRVLAAADRLDVPVRWVHVIELAEAGHLLRGGELVMTTGIALPPDPAGLERYVAGLAAAGASALAVELGSRYTRELPRALVDAAAAHRLPLIVLRRETQFIAVTEAVHERILAAQVAELRAAERLHQVFTDLALAGASADEIVTRASVLGGCPVILEDLAHRVLACAPGGPGGPELEDVLAGFAGRSRAVTMLGRSGYDQASGWLIAQVAGRDGTWGRLILAPRGEPGPGAAVLAERAATAIALAALVRTRAGGHDPRRQAHRSLLAALAGPGHADLAELRARIVAAGLPLAARVLLPIAVLLTRPAPDRAAEIAAAADGLCASAGLPALAASLDDRRVAVLVAVPPEADLDQVARRLAVGLRNTPDSPVLAVGVGPAAVAIDQVRDALTQAGQAAGAAALLHTGHPFARLGDLRLAGLLYQLRDDPRVLGFAERELGPLLAHDATAGTDLVRVLGTYLNAGGKAAAATQAGLARPTLYERLRRIEQLLGVSLETASSRLALHVALEALRLSRAA